MSKRFRAQPRRPEIASSGKKRSGRLLLRSKLISSRNINSRLLFIDQRHASVPRKQLAPATDTGANVDQLPASGIGRWGRQGLIEGRRTRGCGGRQFGARHCGEIIWNCGTTARSITTAAPLVRITILVVGRWPPITSRHQSRLHLQSRARLAVLEAAYPLGCQRDVVRPVALKVAAAALAVASGHRRATA
jgi:hypothetical protein